MSNSTAVAPTKDFATPGDIPLFVDASKASTDALRRAQNKLLADQRLHGTGIHASRIAASLNLVNGILRSR